MFRAKIAAKKTNQTWWISALVIIGLVIGEKLLSYTDVADWKLVLTGIVGAVVSYLLLWGKHYLETGDINPPVPTGEDNATDYHPLNATERKS